MGYTIEILQFMFQPIETMYSKSETLILIMITITIIHRWKKYLKLLDLNWTLSWRPPGQPPRPRSPAGGPSPCRPLEAAEERPERPAWRSRARSSGARSRSRSQRRQIGRADLVELWWWFWIFFWDVIWMSWDHMGSMMKFLILFEMFYGFLMEFMMNGTIIEILVYGFHGIYDWDSEIYWDVLRMSWDLWWKYWLFFFVFSKCDIGFDGIYHEWDNYRDLIIRISWDFMNWTFNRGFIMGFHDGYEWIPLGL